MKRDAIRGLYFCCRWTETTFWRWVELNAKRERKKEIGWWFGVGCGWTETIRWVVVLCDNDRERVMQEGGGRCGVIILGFFF
ncbi:hypothetical protein CsatA_024602 [Cannabis sativa]